MRAPSSRERSRRAAAAYEPNRTSGRLKTPKGLNRTLGGNAWLSSSFFGCRRRFYLPNPSCSLQVRSRSRVSCGGRGPQQPHYIHLPPPNPRATTSPAQAVSPTSASPPPSSPSLTTTACSYYARLGFPVGYLLVRPEARMRFNSARARIATRTSVGLAHPKIPGNVSVGPVSPSCSGRPTRSYCPNLWARLASSTVATGNKIIFLLCILYT
jgi:hypothetical protein